MRIEVPRTPDAHPPGTLIGIFSSRNLSKIFWYSLVILWGAQNIILSDLFVSGWLLSLQ